MYTADLCHIIEQHSLRSHLYADDTQIYGSCRPDDVESFTDRVVACVDDVFSWLQSNRLQPNPDKTEVLWCTTSRRLHRLPVSSLLFGGATVLPMRAARNLGVFFDASLTMQDHVTKTVSRCFGALRQLRTIRTLVQPQVLQSLVTALVLSRLDYGNVVLAGATKDLLRRLQSVQNAAARLTLGLRRRDHITDALQKLHWLRVPERISFKLLTLTYRALHGTAPSYLNVFERVADLPGRRGLRSADSHRLVVPAHKLTSAGGRSFAVVGATLWNSLPPDIANSASIAIFRNRLKTHLFTLSFPAV